MKTLWAIVCLLVLAVSGCCDFEAAGYNGESVLNAGEERRMVWMTSDCDHLSDELIGGWEGEGSARNTRFEIYEDGYYIFYIKRNEKWVKQYDGQYWIDLEMNMGMFRTVLHLSLPDNEDYAVRYHLDEEMIYFEEPDDMEPTKKYKRTGNISL